MTAARSLEPHDVGLARDTYLDAWARRFSPGVSAPAATCSKCRGLRDQPHGRKVRRGLPISCWIRWRVLVTGGLGEAAVSLEEATLDPCRHRSPAEDEPLLDLVGVVPTLRLWDEGSTYAICDRLLRDLRGAGALGRLHLGLHTYCFLATRCGHLADAAAAIAESEAVIEATGAEMGNTVVKALLAVFRGREPEATALIRSTEEEATALGHGSVVQATEWAAAILYNSLGRYEDAFATAERGSGDSPEEQFISAWAVVELLEAATRSGNREAAEIALRRIVETTAVSTTDSAQGISARSRALMSEGAAAENLYEEAVERLGRSRLRPELARAHLLYGEWLRREGRRLERANSSAPASTCSRQWAWTPSPGAPSASSRPPASMPANGLTRPAPTSLPRRPKSPASPETDSRTPRSARGSSSPPVQSNGTSTTYSPSSG